MLKAQGLDLREAAWQLSADTPVTGALVKRRAQLRGMFAESQAMLDTADDLERCNRDWLLVECCHGHKAHVPYTCGRPAICEYCARTEAAKRRRIYTARIYKALELVPESVRLRVVTLPLRQGALEELEAAFVRVRGSAKQLYRLLWGVPAGRREWANYWQLYPVTRREVKSAGSVCQARKHRRRSVKLFAKQHGAVVAVEFGERRFKAHAHLLVLGRYVHQRQVSEAWKLVTGDSYVTDIRARGTVEQRIAEGLKYVTKLGKASPRQRVALYRALLSYHERDGETYARTRRRIEALGILRGKVAGEDDLPPLRCDTCGECMRAVGVIQFELWRMGVRDVPETERFARGPPGG